MKPLLIQLTKAYSTGHPNITFDIQGGGSQSGYQLAETGQIDIGMVAGPISNLDDNVRLTPIARDGIAIILNPENSSAELSLYELQNIFSGRILNWQEVDGLAASIQVVSREDGSGTRSVFETAVMDNHPVTPTAVVMPSSNAVVDFVAKNPNAIGYVSTTFVDKRVYAIPINGIMPELENIQSGEYLLTRELMLITLEQSIPETNRFLEFILSLAGQKIIAENWGTIILE
jgi:phosphate transport system substrate-binding protein